MDETKQPGLSIGQILLARAHFEHRPDFLALPAETPSGDLQIRVDVRIGTDESKQTGYISIVVTSEAEEALYRFQVEMVGLVRQNDNPNMPIGEFLTKGAPAMMYPFVREAVANLTGRGRFGPIWLRPFNWNAIAGQLRAAGTEKVEEAG
jgi:preprotein translocase subunit SecB